MKEVYVLLEQFEDDPTITAIGVCDSIQDCKRLINENYGVFEIINIDDVRDSGIEYVYKIIDSDGDEFKITIQSFNLNKL